MWPYRPLKVLRSSGDKKSPILWDRRRPTSVRRSSAKLRRCESGVAGSNHITSKVQHLKISLNWLLKKPCYALNCWCEKQFIVRSPELHCSKCTLSQKSRAWGWAQNGFYWFVLHTERHPLLLIIIGFGFCCSLLNSLTTWPEKRPRHLESLS